MRTAILLVSALVLFSACSKEEPEVKIYPDPFAVDAPLSLFEAVGVIKSIKTHDQVLIIDHEAIPGFMDAMEMPFPVEKADLLKTVKVGMKVDFTLEDKGGWEITKIKKFTPK